MMFQSAGRPNAVGNVEISARILKKIIKFLETTVLNSWTLKILSFFKLEVKILKIVKEITALLNRGQPITVRTLLGIVEKIGGKIMRNLVRGELFRLLTP